MYLSDGSFVYSPSDLSLFLESPYASWMERLAIESPTIKDQSDGADSMLEMLAEKGLSHEEDFLILLKEQGKTVVEIPDNVSTTERINKTTEAMHSGAEVIFQGCLHKPPFRGFSDFLIKVDGQSKLGNYHYEVWDTKLAKSVKPYFIIQLSCYAEMLESIQGIIPNKIAVVLGTNEIQSFTTSDYYFFYLSLKERFLKQFEDFDPDSLPDPTRSKSHGRWTKLAKQWLNDNDHLSLVATISKSQIKHLEAAGINTAKELSETTLKKVPKLSDRIFHNLKAQANIQKQSEALGKTAYEILRPAPGEPKGLAFLPPPSPEDVFFDIEGFPLVDGGLEYLWGNTYFDEAGERKFIDFWAHNAEEEKQSFNDFIQWVYARWCKDPSMHIYHYANYEIAACRKLMGRYGVCEYEVDLLLRNEVFVDLYKVVKQGVLLGEPRYSIKNVEHLYRGSRGTEVADGAASIVVYEQWRQQPDGDHWTNSKVLNDIRDYNIDDCDSTQELVDWLRKKQQELGIPYVGKTEKEELELPEEITEITKLRDELLKQSELEKEANNNNWEVTEMLAWLLEFHRREAKPVWWRLFDRLGLEPEDLENDIDCLANCVRTVKEPYKSTPRARHLCYQYKFNPAQEFKHGAGASMFILSEDKPRVKVEGIDMGEGLIELKSADEPSAVITLLPDEYVNPAPIPQSIFDVVSDYKNNSNTDSAIADFLKRSKPRFSDDFSGPLLTAAEPKERLAQLIQRICKLDNSYLPIQGPPGAGKTYTGKHIILELLKLGMSIGIVSNSHKAIDNLLIGACELAAEKGVEATFIKSKDTDARFEDLGVSIVPNGKIANHISSDDSCLVGTTAWGFTREDLKQQFDYIFVDEAGQVSVANLVGMSGCCRNIILLGDQMQLGQPAQGSHPGLSGLSSLDYLMLNQSTIDPEMGVFLDTTYRMHPDVNRFISEAIYAGKLYAAAGNEKQLISLPSGYSGPLNKQSGLIYVPVVHEGNTQSSSEEISKIQELTAQLMERRFTDKDGNTRPITWDDILFVAPYNHQVRLLSDVLGKQAKVGSVDKFQGQEAPIVILSLCASDATESSRGMEFILDRNRMNVAISRAQAMAIVVANPGLVDSISDNLKGMELANLFSFMTTQ